MADRLSISSEVLDQLRALQSEPKFEEDVEGFYPGAPSEKIRARCEANVNLLLDALLFGIQATPTKQFVLAQFCATLPQFEAEDSEEKDRLLAYLEQIMDITGMESSDGQLNEWRYGFDPSDA